MRRPAQIILLVICIAAAFFEEIPRIVDMTQNKLVNKPPYTASDAALKLHRELIIADLHADSLLWGRDLLARSKTYGHVDIPRLADGNVALQVFSLPTKSPHGLNIESNEDKNDDIFWLAIVEHWPPRTWNSLTERALYQARRLHQFASSSQGGFVVIESAADLSSYLDRRRNRRLTAGLLSIEGAHALDGKLENLDVLYRAGYRMMSPSHFFDNDIGGSSAGVQKTGLTEKGREWVRQMEARHMIVDLAHASAKTREDVIAIASRPPIVSHTGVKGTCNNNRNLSDDQIQAIASKGGLIGIGYWDTATCGTDAQAIVKAMRYVSGRVGVEHVALGSDFDGAITAPFDTTGLPEITDAMLHAGYSEQEIRMIMGENVMKFLQANLPEK